jgi:hypothetical protein
VGLPVLVTTLDEALHELSSEIEQLEDVAE